MRNRKSAEAARWLTAIALLMFLMFVTGVSTAWAEVDPGREIEANYGGVWHNNAALSRVEEIGNRLVEATGSTAVFEYKLLNTDELNAMALADGRVYVTRGMYECCRTDSELAFVLAHEIVHVVQRHVRKQTRKRIIAAIGGALIGAGIAKLAEQDERIGDWAKTGAMLMAEIAGGHYSREDEYLADAGAVDWMIAAGFNPNGAIEAMEAIRGRYGDGLAHTPVIGWFASHPDTGSRIANIKERIAKIWEKIATLGTVPVRGQSPSENQDPDWQWDGDTSDASGTDGHAEADASAEEKSRPPVLDSGFRRNDNNGRPRQRVAIVVEDASQGRSGGYGYGSGRLFFYESPVVSVPSTLIREVSGVEWIKVDPSASAKIILSVTHYQATGGEEIEGEINGTIRGARVSFGAKDEAITASIKAELRIENPDGSYAWVYNQEAEPLEATETGSLKELNIEIRHGKYYGSKGVDLKKAWWKTPAGKATEEVCLRAARALARLDFTNLQLQNMSVFQVAVVRGEKIYVTTDGSLEEKDILVVAGPAVFIDGEFFGYEQKATLRVVDATQLWLVIAMLVEDDNGKIGPVPTAKDLVFKKVSPGQERASGRRR